MAVFFLTLRKRKIIIKEIKNEISENTLYTLDNIPKPKIRLRSQSNMTNTLVTQSLNRLLNCDDLSMLSKSI